MNQLRFDALTPAQKKQVRELCKAYCGALEGGLQPKIADYLGQADDSIRAALFQELVYHHIEYKKANDSGWTVSGADYVVHCPDPELLKDVLARFPAAQPVTPADPAVGTTRRVGPYKLLEKLGEGGMGVVWRAEQTESVRREVAIKFIKEGFDSRQVLARFEQERQALAMMNHPNIVKVLDAGSTEAGSPYFVMELVKGIPITEYCDQNKLTPHQRLALCIPICQAVQHSHHKGIVHRDIKPSNVIVALYDGKPVPKVMDFGVAKALHGKLTDKTLFTKVRTIIGSLEYMAPEQAEVNNEDIDTRADIYSLGVMLYELLTGSPPFTARELDAAAYAEMLRIIKEDEPPKPSIRLSSSEKLAGTTHKRKLELKRLSKLVTGDLDWIVMKCLEKDRGRRYETASNLARDLERYLGHEPVEAGPPTWGYRFTKFVRRNKGPVLAACLILLALVGGVFGTTWGWVKAWREGEAKETARLDAVQKEALAKAALVAETLANESAKKRLGQIEKSSAILLSIFRDLDPWAQESGDPGLRIKLGRHLETAAAQLDGEAIGDPVTVARLQMALGVSQLSLGNPRQAKELLTRAYNTYLVQLGPKDRQALDCENYLASALYGVGDVIIALKTLEKIVPEQRALFGEKDPQTLRAMTNLGVGYLYAGRQEDAIKILEEALSLREAALDKKDPNIIVDLINMAGAYHRSGLTKRAITLQLGVVERAKIELGPKHPDTLIAVQNLGWYYVSDRHLDKGLELLERIVPEMKDILGEDHPARLIAMTNLGKAYRQHGQLSRAESVLADALARQKTVQGVDHHDTLKTTVELARVLGASDRLDEALALIGPVPKKLGSQLVSLHPDALTAGSDLAKLYTSMGKMQEARQLHEFIFNKRVERFGPKHRDVLISLNSLAQLHEKRGEWNQAVDLYTRAVAGQVANAGDNHEDTLIVKQNLAISTVPVFQKTL